MHPCHLAKAEITKGPKGESDGLTPLQFILPLHQSVTCCTNCIWDTLCLQKFTCIYSTKVCSIYAEQMRPISKHKYMHMFYIIYCFRWHAYFRISKSSSSLNEEWQKPVSRWWRFSEISECISYIKTMKRTDLKTSTVY